MQDENAPRDVLTTEAGSRPAHCMHSSRRHAANEQSPQRGPTAPFAITWCHACLQVLWLAGRQREEDAHDGRSQQSDLAIFPLLFLGANYAYVRALALASPAIVQCVFGAAPAVVCVLSRLWLREPFTRRRGLAVGAALCGVALVAAPSGSAQAVII